MKTIPTLIEAIETTVKQLDIPPHPANLYEPIQYMIQLGGKRLRPLLVLLAYQLRGRDPDKVIHPALAVEVFHNFTLMHDDIMDNAPLRRGKQSVHKKWNDTIAILSGDAMLIKAYQLLGKMDSQYLPLALERFNQTAIEVCEGQQYDMDFETTDRVTEEEYLEMIRLKTAVLLGFSLELGGMIGGIDRTEQIKLYEVGVNMGVGFQLMDDYLDVYADQEKFGKQVGGDIISNKKTYLLISALEKAKGDRLATLENWLVASTFDPEEKVSSVRTIYDELGIPDLVKGKMDSYFDQAFSLFTSIEGDPQAKQMVISLAEKLVKREN